MVILGDCGSLDSGSNLGPGPHSTTQTSPRFGFYRSSRYPRRYHVHNPRRHRRVPQALHRMREVQEGVPLLQPRRLRPAGRHDGGQLEGLRLRRMRILLEDVPPHGSEDGHARGLQHHAEQAGVSGFHQNGTGAVSRRGRPGQGPGPALDRRRRVRHAGMHRQMRRPLHRLCVRRHDGGPRREGVRAAPLHLLHVSDTIRHDGGRGAGRLPQEDGRDRRREGHGYPLRRMQRDHAEIRRRVHARHTLPPFEDRRPPQDPRKAEGLRRAGMRGHRIPRDDGGGPRPHGLRTRGERTGMLREELPRGRRRAHVRETGGRWRCRRHCRRLPHVPGQVRRSARRQARHAHNRARGLGVRRQVLPGVPQDPRTRIPMPKRGLPTVVRREAPFIETVTPLRRPCRHCASWGRGRRTRR